MRPSLTHVRHLSERFVASLSTRPPSRFDDAWARAQLLDGEEQLWDRMSNPDRRHGVAVARAVADELGSEATRPVLAAALLHDVGKVVSGFGTFSRVGATLVWAAVPDTEVEEWLARRGLRRRLAEYRAHPRLGEDLLIAAGSDRLTSAWAADHHRPEAEWRIDRPLGAVLKVCDDD